MFLQPTLPPGSELLLQIAVEPTGGTGTGSHSHQGLGDFTHLMRTRASYEHLAKSLGHLRFIAAIALKDLRGTAPRDLGAPATPQCGLSL